MCSLSSKFEKLPEVLLHGLSGLLASMLANNLSVQKICYVLGGLVWQSLGLNPLGHVVHRGDDIAVACISWLQRSYQIQANLVKGTMHWNGCHHRRLIEGVPHELAFLAILD